MSPNPFYQPVYFDSCAFDGGDETEQQASIKARELFEENGGNMKEIEYPNTPQCVKDLANNSIFTIEVQLTPQEEAELKDVEAIIVGNGNLEK